VLHAERGEVRFHLRVAHKTKNSFDNNAAARFSRDVQQVRLLKDCLLVNTKVRQNLQSN
jgi:hypothetical protein